MAANRKGSGIRFAQKAIGEKSSPPTVHQHDVPE
jgi:hypothetical protein